MAELKIVELPYGDVPAAQANVNRMRESGAGKHEVLNDIRQSVFRGARCWVLSKNGVPVVIACATFGKRKKGPFEPVMTWTDVFTLPAYRREGLAYRLYAEVEKAAIFSGCRYMRALAGSSAGLAFHRNLKQNCWGVKDTGEAFVYHILPYKGWENDVTTAVPPGAPETRRLAPSDVQALIDGGLRYDHAN